MTIYRGADKNCVCACVRVSFHLEIEILCCETTSMCFEGAILSEISKSQEDRRCGSFHSCAVTRRREQESEQLWLGLGIGEMGITVQ